MLTCSPTDVHYAEYSSLLPLMLVAYCLQFLDKITLGNAAIMGIQYDLVSP